MSHKQRAPDRPRADEPPPETSWDTLIAAAEFGELPEIDLHGRDVAQAIRELDAFLQHEFARGTEMIRIIHGRGGGYLRQATQEYLDEMRKRGLVLYYRGAQHPGQQNAVTLAVLH